MTSEQTTVKREAALLFAATTKRRIAKRSVSRPALN